jgi:hypothetical protein
MTIATWKVMAYIEYEIEAETEEEAITRFSECILNDVDEKEDIRQIAEVSCEKLSDHGLTE